MAIYAVAVTPLISRLAESCPAVRQSWFADDDSAAAALVSLRHYWGEVARVGPGYGYFPNPHKTVLLTKPEHLEAATRQFEGTGIRITDDGSKYLGAALGSDNFCRRHQKSKVDAWCSQLEILSEMATTQPQAAYAVYTQGLSSQWTYSFRSMLWSEELLGRMDDIVGAKFLPAVTGHHFPDDGPVRELLGFPVRFGGLAVPCIARGAQAEHHASVRITQPLTDMIVGEPMTPGRPRRPLQQRDDPVSVRNALVEPMSSSGRLRRVDPVSVHGAVPGPLVSCEERRLTGGAEEPPTLSGRSRQSGRVNIGHAVAEIRGNARARRRAALAEVQDRLPAIVEGLDPPKQLLCNTAGEKGVSTWLTVRPSLATGSVLNKSDFRDAVAVRYGLDLDGLPTSCVCGHDMTTHHAFTCPSGGYPSARHDEVCRVIADTMGEVLHDVELEPVMKPWEGEDLSFRTANRATEARLDIRARGFWSRQQDAFFDVRVTHPEASLLSRSEILSHLQTHERAKKRQYGERVTQVERGSFTPLVFSTSGMCAPECERALKNLCSLIVSRHSDLQYSVVMGELRRRISFSLLRWSITCLRGCRASYLRNRVDGNFVASCRQRCN